MRWTDAPVRLSAVASVGGIDLELDDPDVVAGAVFLTTPDHFGNSPWTTEHLTAVPVDGQRVRVIGKRAVFVSLLTESVEAEDTMVDCLELAQRALDLEAAQESSRSRFDVQTSSTSLGGETAARSC